MKQTTVLIAFTMLILSAAAGPVSLAGVTSLRLESEPGDPLGGGEFNFYTSDDGRFELSPPPADLSTGDVRLDFFAGPYNFYSAPRGVSWQMWFAPPPGESLHVGSYEDAVAPFRRGPGQPGLQVTGNAIGCLNASGRFEVNQILLDQNGRPSQFWATFEYFCGGPPLHGEIRFNADPPVTLQAPSHRTAVEGRTLSFEVQGQDALGRPVALTAGGLPPGAAFDDGGDGSGLFSWAPDAGQAGQFGWIAFTDEGSAGSGDSTYTLIDAIPDFDTIDKPIHVTALPFDSVVYQPQASLAADDPVCPVPPGTIPPTFPPGDPGSVWYAFTPVDDERIHVESRAFVPPGPSFPFAFPFAGVSVWTGTRGSLEPIACDFQSAQRFDAQAGRPYFFKVDVTPTYRLGVSAAALPPSPRNDAFDAATVVGSFPFSDTVDTRGAAFERQEPRHCVQPSDPPGIGAVGLPPTNVWYAYTAAEDTRVTVDTSGSNYGALITAFGGPRTALVMLGCDSFRRSFTALAGRTYHVMIAGSLQEEGDALRVAFTGMPALHIHVTIDSVGAFDGRSGAASIQGVAQCSRPAWIVVSGTVQRERHRAAGRFESVVACDGATPWRAAVTPSNTQNGHLRFGAGRADVTFQAVGVPGDNPDDEATDDGATSVTLKGGTSH